MSDVQKPRNARRTTILIVAVLVIVIAAVAAIGAFAARGGAAPAATPTTSEPATASSEPSSSASTSASTPAATPTTKYTPTPAATAPTPHPTRTTTISSAAPITKALTAEVSKMEAVQGKANGPGEVAGPSVRFTITITNTTGKRFDLSSTVVNAYYGAASSPAVQLQEPGGKAFPSSVASGKSVSGVFVFNIPASGRSRVEVTVDTSVLNPVVAFKGAAPKG